MPPVSESSARPAETAGANDYDSFAEAYVAETEANLINGYYARPAILDLAGDVVRAVPSGSSTSQAAAPRPPVRGAARAGPPS